MIGATMAAMLGHSYSPYIRFRGGKGVADRRRRAARARRRSPWPFLLGTLHRRRRAVSRMVSLGSVVIAVEYPILCWCFYPGDWPIIGFAIVAAGLVLWRHRTNIVRIVTRRRA